MREGIVLYDKDGQEIWACANVDARSDDEVLSSLHMNRNLKKQIYRESGQTYALGALPRLFWVKTKCRKSTKRPPCAPCSTTGSSIR